MWRKKGEAVKEFRFGIRNLHQSWLMRGDCSQSADELATFAAESLRIAEIKTAKNRAGEDHTVLSALGKRANEGRS